MSDHDREGPGDAQPRGGQDDRPELDFDRAFAAIVADFQAQDPPGVGPWPASEDVDREGLGREAHDAEAPPEIGHHRIVLPDHSSDDPRNSEHPESVAAGPGRHRAATPFAGDDEDDEEGYVPPEPPPLPRGDLISRLAWAGVIGGPLFLLLAALVWRTVPAGLVMAALGAFVGGFVTLIARMPAEPGDDPHNGAVV
jgi:hypothetical protein